MSRNWFSDLFQDRMFGEDSGDVGRRSGEDPVDPLIVDPVRPPVGDEVVNASGEPPPFHPIAHVFTGDDVGTDSQAF